MLDPQSVRLAMPLWLVPMFIHSLPPSRRQAWLQHSRSFRMAIPPRTLAASWYRNSPLYQLERRAVYMNSVLAERNYQVQRDEPLGYEFDSVVLSL